MSRKTPGWAAILTLVIAGLATTACGGKDPKFSSAAIPDAAMARDAMMMIGTEGELTILNGPRDLCAEPRFGRPIGRARAGAVTVPCWDGS